MKVSFFLWSEGELIAPDLVSFRIISCNSIRNFTTKKALGGPPSWIAEENAIQRVREKEILDWNGSGHTNVESEHDCKAKCESRENEVTSTVAKLWKEFS